MILSVNISTVILGPYGWPKLENGLLPLPAISGLYLMTVNYKDGFLPYGVGITRRLMRKRFMEHTRSFKSGDYNILDLESAQIGVRKIAWKGWGWTDEKRADYDAREDDIVALAIKQLTATRIFVIDIDGTKRVLERLEGALANLYYKTETNLIDEGMLLMPRWKTEESISLTFQSSVVLYGLPETLEI